MAKKEQLKIEWPDRREAIQPDRRTTDEMVEDVGVQNQKPTTKKSKRQTYFQRQIDARCSVLSPDDAKKYRELEERADPFSVLPGLRGLEVHEYYSLRELAIARLI